MKLEQQVVSLELAQKLKGLGVKQESIFSFMLPLATGFSAGERITDSYILGEIKEWGIIHLEDYISAYTVAELGEMLPPNIEKEGFLYWLVCKKEFLRNVERTPVYIVSYESQLYGEIGHTNLYTEADARAKMLIYLAENDLLKN